MKKFFALREAFQALLDVKLLAFFFLGAILLFSIESCPVLNPHRNTPFLLIYERSLSFSKLLFFMFWFSRCESKCGICNASSSIAPINRSPTSREDLWTMGKRSGSSSSDRSRSGQRSRKARRRKSDSTDSSRSYGRSRWGSVYKILPNVKLTYRVLFPEHFNILYCSKYWKLW